MASNLAIKSDENETSGLVKRIDNLENLLKSNLDQFNILSQSLDNLNKNLENKGTGECHFWSPAVWPAGPNYV